MPFEPSTIASLSLGLLPVLLFLAALVFLDSFKLLPLRTILWLLASGALAAGLCLAIHRLALAGGIDPTALRRYVAPLTEETAKGVVVLLLVLGHRVGFLVDGAIAGFAVGAGFATAENLLYFLTLGDPSVGLWVIRGFGTAILHGGLTALVAILTRHLVDARHLTPATAFLPGLLAVAALHSTYNHFFLPPVVSTLVLLATLPALLIAVFSASERQTRHWLGVGFDTDSELLELIETGSVGSSPVGHYLDTLRQHFPGPTLVDMLCLIRLHLELSIQAKGLLLAREAGFYLPPDPETQARLAELRHLEKTIGRAGRLALQPIWNVSSRDLWQIFMVSGR